MSIKVIAFYESGWMPARTDWRQWDHLVRAFGVELQMVSSWEEAKIPEESSVVVVDEEGDVPLQEFMHPGSVVYVFGRTALRLLPHVSYDRSVRITTPGNITLFGISAASMVLYDRYRH